MIKAIVFDIGGVVAKENRESQYSELCKKFNISLEEFQKIRKEKVDLFSRGKITEEEYLGYFCKKFGLSLDAFKKEWIKLAKENYSLNKEVEKIIINLKKNYFLAVLSNIIPLHNNVRKEEDPYKHFRLKLLSFEQGFRKPDVEFYKLLLEKITFNPEEIIFIDDSEEYLFPAKKLGIKTILFKNAEQLKRDLIKIGVIF